jgi:hypothetical protein
MILRQLRNARLDEPLEFLHGGCVGGDEDGAMIAGSLGYRLVEYPALGLPPELHTNLVSHEVKPAQPPLVRTDHIIADCERLYALPKESSEPLPQKGQGTWAGVRHARKANRRTVIIWPNGTAETTCEGSALAHADR